jgi:hypothetical protein
MLRDKEYYNLGTIEHVIRALAGVKVGINLDAPNRNLQNVDDVHADQPAQKTL